MVEIEQFTNKFIEAFMQEKDRFDVMLDQVQDNEMEDLEKDYDRDFMEVILQQREDLQTAVQAFKENLTGKFSSYETVICKQIMDDWKEKEENLRDSQQARNRAIIQEVVATCDKLRDDMRKSIPPCDPCRREVRSVAALGPVRLSGETGPVRLCVNVL